jgi:Zn-dependent protease
LGLAAVGAFLLTKLKFILPAAKFLPTLLKTGGTMLLSIWAYTMLFGWQYAVGLVLLFFVHELGHVAAARLCGLQVTSMMFIPLLGAMVSVKNAPKDAWTGAKWAYGGPLAGAWAAAACHVLYLQTNNPLFLALASTGYFLNLLNLLPVAFLDGAGIAAALSPGLWLVGFSGLVTWLVWRWRESATVEEFFARNIILLILALFSVGRVFWFFSRNKSPESIRYLESVTTAQRIKLSFAYFGLIGLLAWGMAATHVAPEGL